jgi:hypothetical protein
MPQSRSFTDKRRRFPAGLALFGLLLQLFVSFAHIHSEDYRFLIHGHGGLALSSSENDPGSNSSPVLPDVDCPICASAMLLGSSTLPDAVALPLPRIAEIAPSFLGVTLRLTPPRHLLFSTRGPPSV